MPNSNQAINFFTKIHRNQVWLYLFIALLLQTAHAQTQQDTPTQFQNLTTNQRALEKNIELTVDDSTSPVTQNLALDKTGFILHIQTAPRIRDENTKIKIFSQDGEELQTYNFIENGIFGLVDPDKTYSIIQEIKPNCQELISALSLDPTITVCPDKEAFKLFDNIMLTGDTSYMFMLRTPTEFYSLVLNLPLGTTQQSTDFKNVEINNTGENTTTDIKTLLNQGEICLTGNTKSKNKFIASKCTYENSNTQTLITIMNDFKDKTGENINLAFSFLPNVFNTLSHELLFTIAESVRSENKFLFENYSSNFIFNLGKIKTSKTRIKKNAFSLTTPFHLNKPLNRFTINIPLAESDVIVTPFIKKDTDSVLTNLSILGKEKNSPNTFNISLDNNVQLKNSFEPPDNPKANTETRLQTNPELENLIISSFLPVGIYKLTLTRKYSSIEQNIAPTVDDEGKTKEVINNKSKLDLILVKDFSDLDLNTSENTLNLVIEKASKLFENMAFTSQLPLSGFLIPPDFRPVVEEGYRATIELFMSIKLTKEDILNIEYSDLKTKDEVPFTNFFTFSFLPKGLYNAKIKFDSDREKIFQMAGLAPPSE